jgi:hypothetical protein
MYKLLFLLVAVCLSQDADKKAQAPAFEDPQFE